MVSTETFIESHYVTPTGDIRLKYLIPSLEIAVEEIIPEKRLLLAVLYRAGKDLAFNKKKPIYQYAHQWFKSPSTRPLSYLWICGVFDFNPKILFEELSSIGFLERSSKARIKD